jgi:hypothetical protein
MNIEDKIKNTNLKVIARYSGDNITEGEVYDVIDIETFTLEKPHNGAKTVERVFMLRILIDDEEYLLNLNCFNDYDELRRELKLRMLSGHSSISEKTSKLTISQLLDLVSVRYGSD